MKSMIGRAVLILLATTCIGWAEPTVRIGDVAWYTDYDQALVVAREEGKPLWLHFGENPG